LSKGISGSPGLHCSHDSISFSALRTVPASMSATRYSFGVGSKKHRFVIVVETVSHFTHRLGCFRVAHLNLLLRCRQVPQLEIAKETTLEGVCSIRALWWCAQHVKFN
jgi:hypothetical protein